MDNNKNNSNKSNNKTNKVKVHKVPIISSEALALAGKVHSKFQITRKYMNFLMISLIV